MNNSEHGKSRVVPIVVDLVIMYVVTGIIVVGIILFDISDTALRIGMIAAYMLSCFIGGFLIGKNKKEKKYLWGLTVGALYFAVQFFGNLAVSHGLDGITIFTLITAVICMLSGIVGSIVS